VTQPPATPQRIEISSYSWPEIDARSDLPQLLTAAVDLHDGDVVVITSKVVSKAESRVESAPRTHAVEREAMRVVARRGPTVIAQTRHGLVMAAAGVDASNVEAGSVVTLPPDPDESARALRERLRELTGANVAVVVTDTAGRAWRNGQTDMAIGCAGIAPLVDLAGTVDTFGNQLSVTAPAVGDEIAGAADLVKGKASGRPVAVVRGLSEQVLPAGDHGAGASTLVRAADDDLFGLGSRDAVVAAVLRRDRVALSAFPTRIDADPDPFEGVGSDLPTVRFSCSRQPARPGGPGSAWVVQVEVREPARPEEWMSAGVLLEKISSLTAANRLVATPLPGSDTVAGGWRTVTRTLWSVA
jgi:coenzyme F420-0:L-glutamate ligase/coenzyme F420-1:gamma-L-glutamate ligase